MLWSQGHLRNVSSSSFLSFTTFIIEAWDPTPPRIRKGHQYWYIFALMLRPRLLFESVISTLAPYPSLYSCGLSPSASCLFVFISPHNHGAVNEDMTISFESQQFAKTNEKSGDTHLIYIYIWELMNSSRSAVLGWLIIILFIKISIIITIYLNMKPLELSINF